jgi:hypothetical protein
MQIAIAGINAKCVFQKPPRFGEGFPIKPGDHFTGTQ